MNSLHEQDFNQCLARVMTGCYPGNRISFIGEAVGRLGKNGSHKRGDIMIGGFGLTPVVVEGEYSDRPGCNPDKDALNKLGVFDKRTNQPIRTAVAVRYPKLASSWKIGEVDKNLVDGATL